MEWKPEARLVQNNKTINNRNVSMRLFGSTGEPDGRGDGIWDGGLVVSLQIETKFEWRLTAEPTLASQGGPLWLRAAAIAYEWEERITSAEPAKRASAGK